MDVINSRLLTHQDGYYRRFSDPGVFYYTVSAVPESVLPENGGFEITVNPSSANLGEGKQHIVSVSWHPENRRLTATPEHLTIAQHDVVLWQAAAPTRSATTVFAVRAVNGEFNSAALDLGSAFSHLFLAQGEYPYAVGGGEKYLVKVNSSKGRDPAQQKNTQPAVVIINGYRASLPRIEVVPGQTVIWAIEAGDHVTIRSESIRRPDKATAP